MQIVANVVPIFVTLALSLLHHKNIRITDARTSNLKMEPIRFVPLYFVAMFHSMAIVI
jgi:hypothetical protein